MTGLHVVGHGQHRRHQRNRRLVVRMPAGIRLGGQVLRHRDLGRHRRLALGDEPSVDQGLQHLGRGRAEELAGHLDPRDLGDDLVRCDDGAICVTKDAGHPIANQWERQLDVCGTH